MPKPKKPATPLLPDLDVLHDQLNDEDISYLLSLRVRLHKQQAEWDMVIEMRRQLKEGVDIVFKGEVTGTRRPTPGEMFRMRQFVDAFRPADFNAAAANSTQNVARSVATDPDVSIAELRRLATQRQDIDNPRKA